MNIETLQRLPSRQGQQALQAATDELAGSDVLSVVDRLRRLFDPDLASLAITQARLRTKARAKLGDDAAVMYFTPDGLEQATHRRVVAHRARRFTPHRGHGATDLTAGIGVDAIGLARADLAVSWNEVDPTTAFVASMNFGALGLEAQGGNRDSTDRSLDDEFHFIDPARRTGAGRTFRPDDYAPPWSFVEQVMATSACVKAAPGLPHDRIPAGAEAEWISVDGGLKEVAVWTGELARQPGRRATVLQADTDAVTSVHSDACPDDVPVGEIGRYLYDPDDAVTVAHLVGVLADGIDGRLVAERLGYVTSDRLVATPLARAYEVLEVLPYTEKQLKAALRERGVGRLTIKKRGVQVPPEQLRRRLALAGDNDATIVLTRTPTSSVALLVEPIS